MHDFLLKEAKVAVVPGLKEWFGKGAEGYIRMSFASSEEVVSEALYRIKKSLR
jgi:bifunctional pyridoxal-dependent enzyme with beta-cystathionase and maltose regulon repressor activities